MFRGSTLTFTLIGVLFLSIGIGFGFWIGSWAEPKPGGGADGHETRAIAKQLSSKTQMTFIESRPNGEAGNDKNKPPQDPMRSKVLEETNFAGKAYGAYSFGGKYPEKSIDGQIAPEHFTSLIWEVKRPQSLQVNFRDPIEVNLIRCWLWEEDERYYRYKLEISPDTIGSQWELIADCTTDDDQCRGLQAFEIKTQLVGRIRITGTFDSKKEGVRIVEVEAYKIKRNQKSKGDLIF